MLRHAKYDTEVQGSCWMPQQAKGKVTPSRLCRSENKERELHARSSLKHTQQIYDFEFAKHCTQ